MADIGGTNARLALCENGVILPSSVRSFVNDDWPHFYDILASYLATQSPPPLVDMVIALAGPVIGSRAELTNRNWVVEADTLAKVASCDTAILLNDLTALGYAVSVLGPDQLGVLFRGEAKISETEQSLVIGIGTGFNAGPVIKTKDGVRCLAIEAGHVSMPRSISGMIKDLGQPDAVFATVEELFSGRGFTAFCQMITHDDTLQGVDAIASYGAPDAKAATAAIDHYADLLGQMLREMYLAYMPNSGIYLAGSVARAVCAAVPSRFTQVFATQCTVRAAQSPDLFTINDDRAALSGCVAFC